MLPITERQKEIMVMICDGKSNKMIADELGIGKRTLEKHKENIMTNLQLKNTVQISVYAIRNGIYNIQ